MKFQISDRLVHRALFSKSSLVRRIARERGLEMINIKLSAMDPSNARGLPI